MSETSFWMKARAARWYRERNVGGTALGGDVEETEGAEDDAKPGGYVDLSDIEAGKGDVEVIVVVVMVDEHSSKRLGDDGQGCGQRKQVYSHFRVWSKTPNPLSSHAFVTTYKL